MTGQSSPKSGVYDFGVILLELLTGREPVDHAEYGQKSLVAWVLTSSQLNPPPPQPHPHVSRFLFTQFLVNLFVYGLY